MYWGNYFTTFRSIAHVYLQIIIIKFCWKNLHIIHVFELLTFLVWFFLIIEYFQLFYPSVLNMWNKIPPIPWSGLVSVHVAEEYARRVFILFFFISSCLLQFKRGEEIPCIPWSGLVSFHVAEEYARHVFIHFFFISSCWGSRYGPPVRTQYRVTVENMSSRTSWQVIF